MWMKCGTPLVLLALLVPTACGQVPGTAPTTPAAPAGATPPAATAPAAAPAAAGPLAGLMAACASCKDKFCASPIGQFMNNGLAPVRVISGGLIGGCCPTTPSAAALAAPADSPDG